MIKRTPICLVALLAVSLGSYLFAHDENAVTEEMKVNLVELEVRAHTLGGKSLYGLNATDFVVKENGRVQAIDSFEEVDLNALNAAERDARRKRTMILLDFKNTQYEVMRTSFDHLRNYVTMYDHGNSDFGLAVNADGIIEFLPFTANREHFLEAVDLAESYYRKSRYKSYTSIRQGRYFGHAYGPFGVPGFGPSGQYRSSHHLTQDYYRRELEILGQFVNYLGVWSGEKNLVLVSNPWDQHLSDDNEGASNNPEVLSMKDIQTTALYNKVTVNVISLDRHVDMTSARYVVRQAPRVLDRTAEVASSTAGSFYHANRAGLAKVLEQTVDELTHYYRIRYYSNQGGDRYRRIQVVAKGANRVATHFSGYYPQGTGIVPASVNGSAEMVQGQWTLSTGTDWMAWTHSGWKKKRANYAISHRVYDASGELLAERGRSGELKVRKRKGSYDYPQLLQEVRFEMGEGHEPARIETTVVDLTSGERLVLSKNLDRDNLG